MRIFPSKASSVGRTPVARSAPDRPATDSSPSDRPAARLPGARSHEGFLLIEVIVSALLVAVIVIATLTGFDAVNRGTADNRYHNEAALLAAESQEQLRSDPASALEALEGASHSYTKLIDGTTYTITQKAEQLNSSGQASACTATEQTVAASPNVRVTSSVTWPQLTHQGVSESSIITPPTGSSLEVDVGNATPPTAEVSGVTAVVKYTSVDTNQPVTREGSTGAAGCVLFSNIRATSATVEIDEKANFVTPSGALEVPPGEVAIAPNIVTHYPVTYDEGGAIEAKFTYEGKAEAKGEVVTGDNFVVSNTSMIVSPELEVGAPSGRFQYEASGEEPYTALTGTSVAGTYAASAKTATATKYARGDLFPFPPPETSPEWTVYAGDCAENNPFTVTKGVVSDGTGSIAAGETKAVKVPMSYANVEVLQGTVKKHTTLSGTAYAAKITNTACSTAAPAPSLPNNAVSVSYVHTQNTTTHGHLERAFQPFGKAELCLQATINRRVKIAYNLTTVAGATIKVYPEELTSSEKEAKRKEEEEAALSKREKEEAPAREKREKEETTLKEAGEKEAAAKTKREAEEATARKQWETEEKAVKAPKITKAERTAKEKTQTEARTKKEAEEKTAKEKRTGEETTLKKAREKEESTAKKAKESEESTKTTRVKEEGEEATERKTAGLSVEAGSC